MNRSRRIALLVIFIVTLAVALKRKKIQGPDSFICAVSWKVQGRRKRKSKVPEIRQSNFRGVCPSIALYLYVRYVVSGCRSYFFFFFVFLGQIKKAQKNKRQHFFIFLKPSLGKKPNSKKNGSKSTDIGGPVCRRARQKSAHC